MVPAVTQRMAKVLAETCAGRCGEHCNAFMHFTQAERIVAELVAAGEIPAEAVS